MKKKKCPEMATHTRGALLDPFEDIVPVDMNERGERRSEDNKVTHITCGTNHVIWRSI